MPQTTQGPAQDAEVVLEVDLVGPMSVRRRDGTLVELPRKVRALFAYLLTRPGATVSRQTLLGLLWGDRAEAQARSSLRQALSVLRAALGDLAGRVLIATGETVSVAAGSVRTDLDRMDRADPAAPPDGFEFLEGLSVGELAFEDWLREERERTRLRLIERQKALAARDAEAGCLDLAALRLAAVLRNAPIDEAAHRALIRLHLRRARTDAAIAQFETCRPHLRAQLGVAPEPATRALLDEVRRLRQAASKPEPADKGYADAAACCLLAGRHDCC